MKRILTTTIAMLGTLGMVMSQGEANRWYFSRYIGLDFNSAPPTVLNEGNPNGVGQTIESSTTVSTAAGDYLFSTNGNYVFDGGLNQISSGLSTTTNAAQGNIVMPVPGTSDQYYVCTVDAASSGCGGGFPTGTDRGARYRVFTVTGTGTGNLTMGSESVAVASGVAECQLAVPKTDGSDDFWWIFHLRGANTFKVYSVEAGGITFDHDDNVGYVFGGCEYVSVMKANNCYDQIALASSGQVQLFDFDANSGTISNPRTTALPGAYGLEFSSSGDYLYVSTNEVSPQEVYQFDISGGTLPAPSNLGLLFGQLRGGHLQLGPDGNIYAASQRSWDPIGAGDSGPLYIGVITNIDSPGATFNPNYLAINNDGQFLSMGLPTFLKSYVSSITSVEIDGITASSTTVCEGDNVNLTVAIDGAAAGAATWIIDGGSPIISDTVNYTFNTAGNIPVQVQLTDNCGRPVDETLNIEVLPVQIPTVSTSCPGPSGTGTGPNAANYIWYDAASGGNVLATGASYNPPSAPATVWVEDATPLSGPYTTGATAAQGWGTDATTGDYNFDAAVDVIITEFKVTGALWTGGNFNVDVEIRDGSSTLIASQTGLVIAEMGETTISGLSLVVPAGTNYTMSLTGGSYQPSSGTPASEPGIITVASSDVFYDVVVEEAYPCNQRLQVDFTSCCSQPTPTLSLTTGTNPFCEGDNFTLTASTSESNPVYRWYQDGVEITGHTAATLTVASAALTDAGDYTVEVVSSDGCGASSSASSAVTITVNSIPTITAISNDGPACEGGTITLSVTVSGSPTFSWTGPNSYTSSTEDPTVTTSATSAMAGTYTVTTTENGCTDTDQTTVTVTPLPSGSGSISPTAAVCEGTTETYTISGISDATSYTWSADNGATTTGSTSTSEDITAGSTDFTITVTPENSCGTSTPITQNITVNGNTGAAGSITGTTSICDNQSNEGFSIASVTNATSYTWTVTGDGSITSGQGTTNITVDFGTMSSYTIEVTPSGLCGDGAPSQLVVNNTGSVAAAISISQNPDPVCSGSDADIVANVTGGGATPTIEWWVDGVLEATNNNTTYTLSSPTGTESVEAILTNSSLACATGIPVTSNTLGVNVEAQPTADITDPSGTSKTINTTSTTLTAAGIGAGESGMWSKPNAGDQGNLVAPLNTTTVTLQDLNSFESGIGDGTTEICWTVSTATGACPDAQECVNVIRQDVSVPNVRPYSDTICESNLPHANIPGDPAPNTGAGETGTWSGVGGAPFTQVGDDLQPDIITSGVYQYVYTIENSGLGVTNRDTVTLQVDASPGTADAGSNQSICATNYTLTGTTPTTGTGLWTGSGVTFDDASSPTATVSGLSTGVNTLTWTVSNGVCPADVSTVDITVSGSVTSPDAGTYPALCETQTSLSLNANSPGSGETGTWSVSGPGTITDVNNPNATLTITGAGTIDITWTISNGVCSPDPFNSTSITVESAPDVAVAGSDSTICGDNITLYANTPSPGTGMWTQAGGSGTGTITSPTSPTSTVTGISGTIILEWEVTNGSACSSNTDQVEITSTGIVTPTVDIAVDNNPICIGDIPTFTASPTNEGSSPTYNWYLDGVLQQSSSSTTYNPGILFDNQQVYVELESSLSCAVPTTAQSTTITMDVENTPNPSLSTPSAICEDGQTTITASPTSGTSTLTWFLDGVQRPETGTSVTIDGTEDAGTWTVEEDNGVCPAATSTGVTAQVDNIPGVYAGTDQTFFLGNSITIDGSTTSTSGTISWNPNTELTNETTATPVFTPTTGTIYTLEMTVTDGACTATDEVVITVREPIKIPNVFTPNGDNENEVWEISGLTSYPSATLEVFNRWGTPVYKDTGIITPWDGMRSGEEMPVATYYFILTLTADDEPITGSVTLVR